MREDKIEFRKFSKQSKQNYMSKEINFIIIYKMYFILLGGTQYRSWLRHYATSRKVEGLIPDEVI
jgi:hypothetical protein